MSWFNDLTSKAEAMLVKLDKDAAQALQNPNGILKSTKLLDQAINSVTNTSYDPEQNSDTKATPSQLNNEFRDIVASTENAWEIDQIQTASPDNLSIPQNYNETTQIPEEFLDETVKQVSKSNTNIDSSLTSTTTNDEAANNRNQASATDQVTTSSSFNQNVPTKKFKLRTSKLNGPAAGRSRHPVGNVNHNSGAAVSSTRNGISLASPGADDIRASINRSLQEYSLSQPKTPQGAGYSNYFDNQPNIIRVSSQTFDNESLVNRVQSSPSFSIDLPNNHSNDNSPTSIASRLIRQSAKKKSTFSLHRVINRLASQSTQSSPLIDERMKMRLRRLQMRATSYARRLNYNFRAYPAMKYWIIGYIIVMQLLVVYVLFFYQSSGSATYLSAQIDKQQDFLAEKIVEPE